MFQGISIISMDKERCPRSLVFTLIILFKKRTINSISQDWVTLSKLSSKQSLKQSTADILFFEMSDTSVL